MYGLSLLKKLYDLLSIHSNPILPPVFMLMLPSPDFWILPYASVSCITSIEGSTRQIFSNELCGEAGMECMECMELAYRVIVVKIVFPFWKLIPKAL